MSTFYYVGMGNGIDGTSFGQSATDKLSLYGKTPIVQMTQPTLAATAQPAASTSTIVGSIQSMAFAGLTLANQLAADLKTFGLYV